MKLPLEVAPRRIRSRGRRGRSTTREHGDRDRQLPPRTHRHLRHRNRCPTTFACGRVHKAATLHRPDNRLRLGASLVSRTSIGGDPVLGMDPRADLLHGVLGDEILEHREAGHAARAALLHVPVLGASGRSPHSRRTVARSEGRTRRPWRRARPRCCQGFTRALDRSSPIGVEDWLLAKWSGHCVRARPCASHRP
jgi:hypothetical protein